MINVSEGWNENQKNLSIYLCQHLFSLFTSLGVQPERIGNAYV